MRSGTGSPPGSKCGRAGLNGFSPAGKGEAVSDDRFLRDRLHQEQAPQAATFYRQRHKKRQEARRVTGPGKAMVSGPATGLAALPQPLLSVSLLPTVVQ